MKIVFCGTIVPEIYDTKLRYLSPAANRFQVNFCKELVYQGNELEILSYIGFPVEENIPDFSETTDFFENSIEYIYKAGEMKNNIKYFMQKLKKKAANADVVITYNIIYAWLLLPYWAKKNKKRSVLILADYTGALSYQNWIKKVYAELQGYSIRKYDFVVGLSDDAKRLLSRKQLFSCMEGGISEYVYNRFADFTLPQDDIVFMYAGLLEAVTGIDILLEAFHNTTAQNIRLLVSGKGSMEELVDKYEEKDKRIINLGYMEYEKYLDTLRETDVLVNPRNMHLDENANNFPSKIMEYLAVGKPIISTKFAGYNRFKDVIIFCESNVDDMKNKIDRARLDCRNDRENVYERNRRFARNFLWRNQVQKFMEFIQQ